jgi:hypothetical protein
MTPHVGKDLMFEFDDKRCILLPCPSEKLIAEVFQMEPPRGHTETLLEIAERLIRQMKVLLASARWKSTPANCELPPVCAETLTFREAQSIAFACTAQAMGLDPHVADGVRLALVLHHNGNAWPAGYDLTLARLRAIGEHA